MPAANQEQKSDLERQYEQLYEQYGKPLEAEHAGQYLAISPTGETLLGGSLREVAQRATHRFGPGNFLYKVGEKSVGKWL